MFLLIKWLSTFSWRTGENVRLQVRTPVKTAMVNKQGTTSVLFDTINRDWWTEQVLIGDHKSSSIATLTTYSPQDSVLGQLLILFCTQSIVYDWRLYG